MKVVHRISIVLAVGVMFLGTILAQQPTSPPQPQADQLAPIGPAQPNRGAIVEQPAGVTPTVPAGFTVSVYAELESPRMMVYAPNGDLFVSSPAANNITVFRDADNDGVFEARSVYAQGEAPAARGRGGRGARAGGPRRGGPPPGALAAGTPPAVNPQINGPILGAEAPTCEEPQAFVTGGRTTMSAPFGMAFHKNFLYVGTSGMLVRYEYTEGDMKAQREPEKILNLPIGGHSTRNVIFNNEGTKMYVSVGSRSNNEAGEPCHRAAVLEFDPDGSDYRLFASGLRNPVGLAWQPGAETETLWTTVNERDNLGDELVPDYATSLMDGGFYGWPYSYIGQNYDPRYEDAFPDLVEEAVVPDVLIPAHSAPLGITFYTGRQFPERYRNGGFVALHGSWNRSVASGYKVAFFPMDDGEAGPLEDFMTGFIANDGSAGAQIQRWGRPVGVTVAPDGSLLVSDDGGNRIWKISAR